MTKKHLQSKISDCQHKIDMVRNRDTFTMQDLLEIHDLEIEIHGLRERILKYHPLEDDTKF